MDHMDPHALPNSTHLLSMAFMDVWTNARSDPPRVYLRTTRPFQSAKLSRALMARRRNIARKFPISFSRSSGNSLGVPEYFLNGGNSFELISTWLPPRSGGWGVGVRFTGGLPAFTGTGVGIYRYSGSPLPQATLNTPNTFLSI